MAGNVKTLSQTPGAAPVGVAPLQPGFIGIKESFGIAATPDEVWRLVRDPKQVAACIPGAELASAAPGRPLQGTIKVKFGPTVVTFKGEVTIQYDDAARRCVIDGRGLDQRGSSRTLANGVVSLSGATETQVTVEGAYRMTGPLEGFARTGGVHVARALIAEFAVNLTALLRPSAAPGASLEAAPVARAQNLSGFRLIRQVLGAYLRQLFVRRA